MRTTALTLTALLACVPAAAAQEIPVERSTGWVFDGEGHPRLESKVFGTATAFVEWRRCPADGGGCVAIPSTPPEPFYASGGIALPGETAPGTVFEAAYVRDGAEVTVRATWKGRVAMAEPPAVTGDAVVGGTVGVRPARWDGGWGTEGGEWDTGHSHVELLACPTPTGGSCWAVDRTLEPRWAGHYLFVKEERHALGVGKSEVLGMLVPPYAAAVDTSSATRFRVFSAPVQIAPAPTVPPVPLAAAPATAKAPVVTLRRRALRAKGRLSLGRVTCSVRCKVAVKVSGGGKRAYTTTFAVTGTRAITAPSRRGNVQVRVHVDGTLSATGRVRAL